MPHFIVETTQDERDKILKVLKETEGRIIPIREIAEAADLAQSRARYAVLDLIEAGKIARVPHKAFNKHYIRYSYKIIQPAASKNIK